MGDKNTDKKDYGQTNKEGWDCWKVRDSLRFFTQETNQKNGSDPTLSLHLSILWQRVCQETGCGYLGLSCLWENSCWWGMGVVHCIWDNHSLDHLSLANTCRLLKPLFFFDFQFLLLPNHKTKKQKKKRV